MALPAFPTQGQILAHWGLRVLGVFICCYLVVPILAFLPLSFSAQSFFHYPLTGLSLQWYRDFFTSPLWLLSFRNTFIVGISTTILATILGVLAALGLWRGNFPGRGIVMTVIVLPLITPSIIVGVGTYFTFAPFGLTNSFAGLIFAHTALAVPFVVVTVLATLSGFDRTMLRAASSLGANPVTAFYKVMLPLILPGVISGALFALATSFDEVVVTLFLAGPQQRTLPRLMFTATADNTSLTLTAAAAVMVTMSLFLMLSVEWLRRRSDRILRGKREATLALSA